MELIDKDAVVAEIERQQRKLCLLSLSDKVELRRDAAIQNGVYCSLLSFINTLEVEEVNSDAVIEKACDWLKNNVIYTHPRTGETKCVVNLNAFRDAMKGE